jgi:alpha-beta hydrolase superfamily lysophospholipase
MFDGFSDTVIDTGEARIRVRQAGSGPPLLLLHGNPQTHVMWHRVAPRLAEDFTVVASDLRGYGDSSKPPSDEQHAPYSKRTMALDQLDSTIRNGCRSWPCWTSSPPGKPIAGPTWPSAWATGTGSSWRSRSTSRNV